VGQQRQNIGRRRWSVYVGRRRSQSQTNGVDAEKAIIRRKCQVDGGGRSELRGDPWSWNNHLIAKLIHGQHLRPTQLLTSRFHFQCQERKWGKLTPFHTSPFLLVPRDADPFDR